MSKHALERLKQRYNKEFTWFDIRNIINAIKHGQCFYVDAANNEALVVLVLYEHIPMKLVYSAVDSKGTIVTALPLDIDEWNENISQIPPVFIKRKKKKRSNNKNN